jgi:hypothetical protein
MASLRRPCLAEDPCKRPEWLAGLFPLRQHTATLTNYAIYQGGVLIVAQLLKLILDRIKIARRVSSERLRSLFELSVALGQAIGVIRQQIESYSGTPEANATRDAFLAHALKCIESTVKLCTDNMDDRYCCVTLLTFESNDMVKIRARSTVAGRPIGGEIPQTQTMAYGAAKYAQQCQCVNHFKLAAKVDKANHLEYRALSIAQPPPYESILLLPLPSVTVTGQNQPIRKGVVTVDSARPYEFLGKEVDILVRVQAYLDIINVMLTNHGVGVQPEI